MSQHLCNPLQNNRFLRILVWFLNIPCSWDWPYVLVLSLPYSCLLPGSWSYLLSGSWSNLLFGSWSNLLSGSWSYLLSLLPVLICSVAGNGPSGISLSYLLSLLPVLICSVAGNGPSGISLSYLLSGNCPYYKGGCQDEMLHARLTSQPHLSLLEQDLEFLSDVSEPRGDRQRKRRKERQRERETSADTASQRRKERQRRETSAETARQRQTYTDRLRKTRVNYSYIKDLKTGLWIRIRMDPHSFSLLDPDPHLIYADPDPNPGGKN